MSKAYTIGIFDTNDDNLLAKIVVIAEDESDLDEKAVQWASANGYGEDDYFWDVM